MIDIVKESMNLLLSDSELIGMLKNNRNAVCRVRAPDMNIKPRVEISLIDDQDVEYYDGISMAYGADIQVSIYKSDSQTFDIGNRINYIFQSHGFDRIRHKDGYIYELDLYVREMAFRCKVLIEGDDFKWLVK